MAHLKQLKRILEIDRLIRAETYPHPESLAQKFDVSRRMIFHDREFLLKELHAPLAFDKKHKGWYYSDKTWVLPTLLVTEGELLAFFLSVEIAHHHLGADLDASLRSAAEKILQGMQEPMPIDLQTLQEHYSFATPAMLSADADILLKLNAAIRDCRALRIRYYTASRDEHTERIVHPHHLHHIEGDTHLIAFDQLRQRLTTFHVGRIKQCEPMQRHFTRDPNFDAAAWIKSMFQSERAAEVVQVVIRFDAYQARWMRERRWHETQEIEILPDGGLIMRFQGSGLGEIKRWVLRYGRHAEVLAPASLRDQVRAEINDMAAVYAPPRSKPATARVSQQKQK